MPLWYGMVWWGGAEQILAFACFYICVGKIDLLQKIGKNKKKVGKIMTMISKLTTAAGTTITKSLLKDGRVSKVINFSPSSKMAKMGMDQMLIIKGKDGSRLVDITKSNTNRRWFFGTYFSKERLTKSLKQFIAQKKQDWGV